MTWKEHIKATFLAAAGVILPIVLLAILFNRVVDLFISISNPFAHAIFPEQMANSVVGIRLVTFLLLLLASVFVGLFAQTQLGTSIGHWIEQNTLMHIKLYRALKEFSQRLIPSDAKKMLFQPALLNRGDEMNALIFIVEEIGDHHVVIFVPSAPTAFSGSLYVVLREDVEILKVPVMDMVKVFSRWGVGFEEVLNKANVQNDLQQKDRLTRLASLDH